MKIAWLLALAASVGAAFTCNAQPAFRIAGTVVRADNGAPLARARVYIMRTGTSQIAANMTTGDDGKFSFDPPQGSYELWAGPRTLPQPYGLRTPEDTVPSSIITGPDQDTAHLTFRWFARGAITGKVVDNNGEPVQNALLQLIRSGVLGGNRVNRTVSWTHTNDLGEYRYYSWSAGTYYLAVTAEPWYAKATQMYAPGQQSGPSAAFAPTYYPNTTDITHASPLTLKPGEEARADFTLVPVAGATVVVHLDAPPAMRGTIGLVRNGIAGQDSFQQQDSLTGALKEHRFSAVPPGHYVLRIVPAADSPQLECDQEVDVNGSDVNVEAALRPPAQVSGSVQFPEAGGRPAGTALVYMARPDGTITASATVKSDGSFSFRRLAPGQYRASIGLSGVGGYFASETKVDGAPFRDGVIDLSDGLVVSLRLTASHEMGRVKGFAMRNEKPAEGVMVVLTQAVQKTDAPVFYAFQTDSDGSYDWKFVRPGDYILFATDETLIEYRNRAAVEPYLPQGKMIHVDPHAVYTESVPVIEAPGRK